MTALKEEAVRMIDNLPEDKVEYVIQYIRDMTYRENALKKNERIEAFARLERTRLHLPSDFDEKKELEEGIDEKYGSLN